MIIVFVLAALAADPPPPDPPMEQTKKNIRVLNGVPSSQLIPIMTVMANSLGVACSHCHETAWESDGKPAKDIGRRMITMTRAINDAHYGGKVVVSCQTCHRGRLTTVDVPLVGDAGWHRTTLSPPPMPSLPSAEELFAKHTQSWGAIEKVQERVTRGVVTARSGRGEPRSAPFEMRQTLPSMLAIETTVAHPGEANRELGSQFFTQMKIRTRYSVVKTIGVEDVRGRAAYVVEAVPADGSMTERLYFDAADARLLRRHRERPTIVGILPEESDFDDYRTVDGVLVPFFMQWSRGDYQVTHRIAEVKQTLK